MILVTGATGIAGSQVVRALLEREDVRVFVRDPDEARRLFGDAAELAVGDFADAALGAAALEGADARLPLGRRRSAPGRVGDGRDRRGRCAGVRRIVKLSSIAAEPGSPVAFWDWHGRIEEHLRGSRSRPCAPALELLHVEPARRRRPGGGRGPALRAGGRGPIAMIDPRDVGAAAAAVLADGRATTARHLRPHGAGGDHLRARSPPRFRRRPVARWSSSTSPTRPRARPLIQAGLPDFVAEQIVAIFARRGRAWPRGHRRPSRRSPVAPPRDFAAFARDHARLFAPVAEAGA